MTTFFHVEAEQCVHVSKRKRCLLFLFLFPAVTKVNSLFIVFPKHDLFVKLHTQPVKVSQGSTYSELLSVIEEMSREIRPTYAGSKSAMERLKRGILTLNIPI